MIFEIAIDLLDQFLARLKSNYCGPNGTIENF